MMIIVEGMSQVLRHALCHHSAHQMCLLRTATTLSKHLAAHSNGCPPIATSTISLYSSLNGNIAQYHHVYISTRCLHTTPKKKIEKKVQENLEKMKKGEFETMTNPEKLTHFKTSSEATKTDDVTAEVPPVGTHALPHPIWSEEELHNIEITHKKPVGIIDRLAYGSVKVLRTGFDILSGYSWRTRSESIWLTRIIFLETVAGVPGMVGAMTRHFHSLRRMRRDHGWIHTLLEEAENERMHLMTALQVKQPGILFRGAVVVSQGIFVNFFFLAYLLSPRFCHRFVGYLEEEAVRTYTKCLQDIESGAIQHWKTQDAPEVAKNYWKLAPDATMKDVILAIRADEAHHRVVNHTFASMKPDHYNPYKPGE